jgi:hypothetical protein
VESVRPAFLHVSRRRDIQRTVVFKWPLSSSLLYCTVCDLSKLRVHCLTSSVIATLKSEFTADKHESFSFPDVCDIPNTCQVSMRACIGLPGSNTLRSKCRGEGPWILVLQYLDGIRGEIHEDTTSTSWTVHRHGQCEHISTSYWESMGRSSPSHVHRYPFSGQGASLSRRDNWLSLGWTDDRGKRRATYACPPSPFRPNEALCIS